MAARVTLEYDGTDFCGWMVQPGLRTVQGVLEQVLSTVNGGLHVPVVVAGRTDSGVHAWGQVVSHPGTPLTVDSLNALLPPDVCVLASEQADEDFDARADATSRTYCFRLLTTPRRSVELRRTVLHWPRILDLAALEACAVAVVGRHDFTAFTPTETKHVRFDRRVISAAWTAGEQPGVLELWITADSFMRHMNRILVGTMLEVAEGRRTLASFEALLRGAHRSEAGMTLAPHGLALASVSYVGTPFRHASPAVGEEVAAGRSDGVKGP